MRMQCLHAHADVTVPVTVVQVGVVRASEGRVFRVLSNAEVEEHLTAISERD